MKRADSPPAHLAALLAQAESLRDGKADWHALCNGDPETLLSWLDTAKEAVLALADVMRQVEQPAAKALRDAGAAIGKDVEVGNYVAKLGSRRGSDSWDHPLAAAAVAHAVMGEYDADADGPVAEYVARRMAECLTSSTAWRSRELKRLRLDPTKYVTKGEFRGLSVSLNRRDNDGEAAA